MKTSNGNRPISDEGYHLCLRLYSRPRELNQKGPRKVPKRCPIETLRLDSEKHSS
jgi:hypothetical protein